MSRATRDSSRLTFFIVYGVLVAHALLTLFPLLWVFANSFRSSGEIIRSITLIPNSFDLVNFRNLIYNTNIPLSFWNSLSITALSLALLVMMAVPLSFALTRFRFKMADHIYLFFTLAVLVPGISVLPMVYKLFVDLGLMGSKYGISLIYATDQLAVSTFVLVAFMRTIPSEVDEAAIVDGANIWQLFYRVTLPLSRNGIVTILILAFVAIWNDYLTALVMLPDADNRTLSVALAFAKTEYTTDYGLMAASIVFAVTPMVIGYILLKEQLTTGITAGAVKG